ncbi:MAG TPA: lysophospholipid acyltransferase family protein [Acidobacteriaceae bacterium]
MFALLKMLFVYTALGPITGIIGIPWTLLRNDVSWMYRAGIWIARAGVRAGGIKVKITGYENVPAGRACVFMSNHVSNLDPPVLIPLIPGRCSVMLKAELMRIPILGRAMRLAHFVPVARGGEPSKAKASIDAAAKALQSGLHIVIFAEGTRSPDGRLRQFKKGPFFLAKETGAPIIPVALSGTQTMMRVGSMKVHPGTARIQLLPAIHSSEYATREELMAAVRNAINAALPAEMQNPVLG